MPYPAHPKDTKALLLNIAEDMFLAKGYEHVRVREITDTARVNVASINYHFHSKDNLYRAVLRRLFRTIARRRIECIDQAVAQQPDSPDLAVIIDAYVRSFFDDVSTSSDHKRHLALLYREMSPDAVAPDLVAKEMASPINSRLRQAIRSACPHISKQHASLCASSITGQVLHFIFMRDILRSMLEPGSDKELLEWLIQHITEFSLRGLGNPSS